MENMNIENAINQVIPFVIKGVIFIGIIVILQGITIAIYSFAKKKRNNMEIGKYLGYAVGLGVLTSFSGLILSYILHFEPDFSSYKHSVPITYIVSVLTFYLFVTISKGDKKSN